LHLDAKVPTPTTKLPVLQVDEHSPTPTTPEPVLVHADLNPIATTPDPVLLTAAQNPMALTQIPVLLCPAVAPMKIFKSPPIIQLDCSFSLGTKTVSFSLDRDNAVPPIIAELQLLLMVLPQPPITVDLKEL
jgi:hypothetical protein